MEGEVLSDWCGFDGGGGFADASVVGPARQRAFDPVFPASEGAGGVLSSLLTTHHRKMSYLTSVSSGSGSDPDSFLRISSSLRKHSAHSGSSDLA